MIALMIKRDEANKEEELVLISMRDPKKKKMAVARRLCIEKDSDKNYL